MVHYAWKEILNFLWEEWIQTGKRVWYPISWIAGGRGGINFFLCKELIPGYLDGITGEYATPEGYLVDEQEAEEFDKQFPYKEKK